MQRNLTGSSRISPGLLVLMFCSLVLFVGGAALVVVVVVVIEVGLTNNGIEHSPDFFHSSKFDLSLQGGSFIDTWCVICRKLIGPKESAKMNMWDEFKDDG